MREVTHIHIHCIRCVVIVRNQSSWFLVKSLRNLPSLPSSILILFMNNKSLKHFSLVSILSFIYSGFCCFLNVLNWNIIISLLLFVLPPTLLMPYQLSGLELLFLLTIIVVCICVCLCGCTHKYSPLSPFGCLYIYIFRDDWPLWIEQPIWGLIPGS